MAKQKSFYMTPRTEQALRTIAADSLSEMINKVVDRYDLMMALGRVQVNALFTDEQWARLVDVCRGTRKMSAAQLQAVVQKTFSDDAQLRAHLDALTAPEIFCIIEMAEAEALQEQPPSPHVQRARE